MAFYFLLDIKTIIYKWLVIYIGYLKRSFSNADWIFILLFTLIMDCN